MSVEIAFRVNDGMKNYLKEKCSILKINLSELIRVIIDKNKIFSLSEIQILDIFNCTKDTNKYNSRIYVQVDKSMYNRLYNLSQLIKLKISELMRTIISLDNTEIIDDLYMNKCISMLYPVGLNINQIAYQLNYDNKNLSISKLSYEAVLSGIKYVKLSLISLCEFIKNLPYDELDDIVLLSSKNTTMKWFNQIAPIKNNINQITQRLYIDFGKLIINQNRFESILVEIKVFNKILNQVKNSIINYKKFNSKSYEIN